MEQTFTEPWDNNKHVGLGFTGREACLWGGGEDRN